MNWREYLSVESLRAMATNDPISSETILPLAEEHARFKKALEEIAAMRAQSFAAWWRVVEIAKRALEERRHEASRKRRG